MRTAFLSWTTTAMLLVEVSIVNHMRAETLVSGPVGFSVEPGTATRFFLTNLPAGEFQADHPICLQLLAKTGTTLWLSNTYSSVIESGGSLRCVGTILTPAGSVFEFTMYSKPGANTALWN